MPRLVALGGLGEFGANSLLVEDEGGSRVLVDAGAAFSDLAAFGVGYEVPDFGALGGEEPAAVVLTHAHDDHVKGVAFLREAYPAIEVAASRTTLAWVRAALANGAAAVARELQPGNAVSAGAFAVHALPVSHSIPGTVALRIEGADGTLVLATDLRLAPSALEETTSQEALAAWDAGTDVLLLDDERADRRRAAVGGDRRRSDRGAGAQGARGRDCGLVRLAARALPPARPRCRRDRAAGRAGGAGPRRVARGLKPHRRAGASSGPGAARAGAGGAAARPGRRGRDGVPGRTRFGVFASRGRPLPGLRLRPGDTVLHAARVIPGNERRLALLFDHCVRRGARVVTAAEAPIHASGHPHRAELARLLELVRPSCVIPVHGRRRHLEAVAELARARGIATLVVENGEEVAWGRAGARATGELRQVGRILFDDVGEEVLDPAVLRHRRSLAREGLVVAVLPCSRAGQDRLGEVQIHVSGMPVRAGLVDHLAAGLAGEIGRAGILARRDPEWLRSTMTRWLRSEVRRRTRRRPVVVALVVEL